MVREREGGEMVREKRREEREKERDIKREIYLIEGRWRRRTGVTAKRIK